MKESYSPIFAQFPSTRSPNPISSQKTLSHPHASISRESDSCHCSMCACPRYVHLQTVVHKLRVSSPVALQKKKHQSKNVKSNSPSTTSFWVTAKSKMGIHLYANQSLRSIHLQTIDQDSCRFSFTHRSCKCTKSEYETRNAETQIQT